MYHQKEDGMKIERSNKKRPVIRLITAAFAAVLMIVTALQPAAGSLDAHAAEYTPFYRLDSNHPDSGLEKLKRVRLLTAGQYELEPLSPGDLPGQPFQPSLKGLDSLRISGSPQYTERQFRELAARIRACAGNDPVYIIDLRQESHFFVNGMPVSVYGHDNTANRGLGLAEVEADENARIADIRNNGLTLYPYGSSGSKKKNGTKIENPVCMTERELAESEGFGYLRLPATDHEWPTPDLIDEFIGFVSTLDTDHVWLHFHCLAGRGRTGVYMAIYDMMKNPDVSVEDISLRQAMAGSSYILKYKDTDPDLRKVIRARNLRLMEVYIRENRGNGYQKKWSEWLAEQEANGLPAVQAGAA